MCWACGLLGIVHWSYNFQYDPDFFSLSQIGKSLFSVGVFYVGGALLIGLFMEKQRRRSVLRSCAITILTITLICTAIWARPSPPDCAEVVRRMKDSGVAYNAREGGLLGGIKIDDPSSDRFSPDAKQLAWWGKFGKPFEYWGNPDLTSNWFDPEGKQVASIEVETEHCKLAKAVIKQEGFQPGIWRVDVVCENDGKVIDQQRFAVGDPPVIPSDVQAVSASVPGVESKEIRV